MDDINWFNIIVKSLIFLSFTSLIIFGPLLTEYFHEKEEEKLIKEGKLRRINHAEYNNLFGIKNKLKIVNRQ